MHNEIGNLNTEFEAHDAPHALNLFFTGRCNLNCNYCFVEKEQQKNSTLSELSLRKSVDQFLAIPGGKKLISFNGGEPLLEWRLLKKIYSYAFKKAKSLDIFLDIVIVTNGTLLTQEIVDFFSEHGAILKISIDGDKQTHDAQRPFSGKSKKSTFELVMSNLENINWKGVSPSASMVFTPDSISKLNENIKFLSNQGFASIELYPELYAKWTNGELNILKKQLKELEKNYVESFKKNKPVFKNSLIDSVVNGVLVDKSKRCPNIQIDSSGNYYVCDKVMSLPLEKRSYYEIGNSKNGIDFSKREKVLRDIRKEIDNKSKLKCAKCGYQKYCFCPLQTYFEERDNFKKRDMECFCKVSKLLIGTCIRIATKLEYDKRFVQLYRF